LPAGWRVERFASLGSSNDEARLRALAGDPGRLWIVAGEQTQGRGRRGRAWSSPPGNLYASALLVDPCEPAIAPQIGFAAGVALLAAARDLGGAGFALKWPNDLLWNGAKVSGLLVEGLTAPGGGFACAVGIGVNCASAPQGLTYPVAHLSGALGRLVAPEAMFVGLAARFAETIGLWARGAGFDAIRAQWLAGAAGIGGPIRLATTRGSREGRFEGLDASGRLMMRTEGGLETIEAADLILMPRPDDGAPRDEDIQMRAARRRNADESLDR
jgi:BirA family transcriptional regulator, biotin operon repressor / biotin---[acetyl-CoA-carboxylase] ligase